jgi:NAD(P)-dependent dehydrogenase (short-subunit alcohol dehydrogenase family)
VGGQLAGRVAVVTGASRGIGEAITRRFASEGATVVAVARTVTPNDRLPGSLSETVDEVVAAGGKAIAVQADLGVPEARARLIAEVHERVGTVDVLVNNAAVTWLAPADSFSMKRYDLMFDVQVRAPFELIRSVIPDMRERGQGWILNVSSLAAVHPSGPPFGPNDRLGTTVYGMCKAALERMSSGLAAEMSDDGIAVNSLAPTKIVATWGTVHHGLVPDDAPDEIEYPQEFAEAAVALCAGDPRSLTGRILHTDQAYEQLRLTARDLDGTSLFERPQPAPTGQG